MKPISNKSRRKEADPRQLALLSASGTPPFIFLTDAIPIRGSDNSFAVEDMHFRLEPQPKNCQRALEMVIASLGKLRLSIAVHCSGQTPKLPITLDMGDWTATARFWFRTDTTIIQSTYSQGHLDILLPRPRLWQASGLGWLGSYDRCCERNALNPTPWLGKPCDCGSKPK